MKTPSQTTEAVMPFTMGPTELIIVLVIALALFGAGKLPEVGGALGRGIREFRSAQSGEPEATHLADQDEPRARRPPT